MNRTLISLAILATAVTTGSAFAQTAIAGGPGIMLPPGGANAAEVMITSNGPVHADTSIAQVVANAPAPMATQRLSGQAGWAQKRIELDGYTGVQNVTRGPDGRWHATAMRGNTAVQVIVDRRGNVLSM